MQQMCIQGTLTLGSIISPWAKPVCPAWAAPPGPRNPAHEVQAALDAALAQVVVKGKAPVLLRLAFHDAGTFDKAAGNGGMNASIGFELDRPESFGLKRGWNLVIRLEESLKGTPAEGQVSRADLIALMGAAAVSVTGGPRIAVPIGRSDALGPDPGVMSRMGQVYTTGSRCDEQRQGQFYRSWERRNRDVCCNLLSSYWMCYGIFLQPDRGEAAR